MSSRISRWSSSTASSRRLIASRPLTRMYSRVSAPSAISARYSRPAASRPASSRVVEPRLQRRHRRREQLPALLVRAGGDRRLSALEPKLELRQQTASRTPRRSTGPRRAPRTAGRNRSSSRDHASSVHDVIAIRAPGSADPGQLVGGTLRGRLRRSSRRRKRPRRSSRRRTGAPARRPRRTGSSARPPPPRHEPWSADPARCRARSTSAPTRAAIRATPPVPHAEVEKPLARAELEPLDDALVDRREGLGDPLVVRTAPGVGRVAQSAPSIARLVSSVRTFQSSG